MTRAQAQPPLILGIDGGNSKVDLCLADGTGKVLAARRGATISHQAVGIDAGMARLTDLAQGLLADALFGADSPADICVATVAGADYPEDVRLLTRSMGRMNLGRELLVENDTFGALRAGTTGGWGVGLICGQGINAGAIAPSGRRARFPGVGDYAGDWGGGGGIANAAIRAAVRGTDGRGPRTSLSRSIPAFFGVRTPAALTRGFYFGRITESSVSAAAPVVFADAAAGDAVARAIIDQLAEELALMAVALIRRLRMTHLDVEVVLAGGVFRTRDEAFYARLSDGIKGAAARARIIKLDAPPVAGAVLLGMDELARRGTVSPPDATTSARLRAALRDWDGTIP